MVGVLRKPLEAGTVGLARLERSLPPCGLCQALFFTADSRLHLERVTIAPKLPCKASGAACQSCHPESQRCQGAAGPHGGHVPPDSAGPRTAPQPVPAQRPCMAWSVAYLCFFKEI